MRAFPGGQNPGSIDNRDWSERRTAIFMIAGKLEFSRINPYVAA